MVPYFSTVLTLMIAIQERLEDSGTLLYPSITFCPKYIWQVTSPDISHSCYTVSTPAGVPGGHGAPQQQQVHGLPRPQAVCPRQLLDSEEGAAYCVMLSLVMTCPHLSLYAQVFSFVSHQNAVPNQSFPCNTVGGSKKGKPCAFPFIYQVGYISSHNPIVTERSQR